jgi:hypothetical protein
MTDAIGSRLLKRFDEITAELDTGILFCRRGTVADAVRGWIVENRLGSLRWLPVTRSMLDRVWTDPPYFR